MTAKKSSRSVGTKQSRGSKRLTGRGRARAVVPVDLGERSYRVELGHDWLTTIGRQAADRLNAERVALITVPTVARRYAPLLTRGLEGAGARVKRIVVPDGDGSKNLTELAGLYDRFLDHGLDRSSGVVTLGGGVAGDLGGFAAATFLRGIPFVQVSDHDLGDGPMPRSVARPASIFARARTSSGPSTSRGASSSTSRPCALYLGGSAPPARPS